MSHGQQVEGYAAIGVGQERLRVIVVRRGERDAAVGQGRSVGVPEGERLAFAVADFHLAGAAEEVRRRLARVEAGTFGVDHAVVPGVPVPEAEADGAEKFAVVLDFF